MQQIDERVVPVRVTEHLWITLRDGTRLAARLWLPDVSEPVPAVLEYIPYRKSDGTRGRDEPMHHYFASRGLAAIRVDMRGSGESDGLLEDEYLKLEQDDALEVIDWIARQPWCSGAVGMMGKSWGGFNSLQVAARRPAALKAIITVCSTDERYGDDIHYKGGCLLNDNLWWGAIMMAYQGRPPDPRVYGDGWRDEWLKRLDQMPFFPALWMAHPHRDAYWKHGSVCEDWEAIQCPVLAVGGWMDSYTNAVFRLVEKLKVPRQGLIGPWAHIYPQDGVPGPAIGFLQEAVRWWNRWLREPAGSLPVENGPMVRAWIETARPPSTTNTNTPGRWVGEPRWPSPSIRQVPFHLGDGVLRAQPGAAEGAARTIRVRTSQGHGSSAGEWMGAGVYSEAPADQRLDDGLARVFDSGPLAEPVELLGMPELDIELSSDRPVAYLCARLSEVLPDGSATRVSYGVFNLTHRDSAETPEALVPGQRYRVRLKLDACGHEFAPGNRIRLSLATTYWPLIWPAPQDATLEVALGQSVLRLPVRAPGAAGVPVSFDPPARGPATPTEQVRPGQMTRTSSYDLGTGEWTYVTAGVGGVFGEGVLRFTEIDTTVEHDLKRELTVRDNDPTSARYRLTQSLKLRHGEIETQTHTELEMRSDATHFYLDGVLRAEENGITVRERRWQKVFARHLQ